MEQAEIKFKDKTTEKEITLDISYDKETSNLDYNLNLDKSYSGKEPLDFIGFLAYSFLEYLKTK